MTFPDSMFVRTRHMNSNDSAATSNRVEPFARRSLRSSIPPANQFVKCARYTPIQAMATTPAQMYSADSQRDSVFVSDVWADGVRVILPHKPWQRRVPLVFVYPHC